MIVINHKIALTFLVKAIFCLQNYINIFNGDLGYGYYLLIWVYCSAK